MIWSPEKVLLVIRDPENMKAEEIQDHVKEKDNTVAVLLVRNGDLGKGVFANTISGLLKKNRIAFNLPGSQYKLGEFAVQFVVAELGRHGKQISERLAEQLVNRVGMDLGYLSFECLKVTTYMDALGAGPQVEREHVAKVLSQIGTDDLGRYLEALKVASVPRVLRALTLVREATSEPPTLMPFAWTQNAAIQWLQAAECARQGLTPKEGAARVEMNPWVYENKVLPVARRWGHTNIKNLLHHLARAKASVHRGHLHPWVGLMTHLVQACDGVGSGR